MAEIASSVVTAVLMLLMLRAAATLVDPRVALAARRVPWAAVALTGLAVAGLAVQATWSGSMAALDQDPSRPGWWRPLTAVFLQDGGVAGAVWNLVTLALVAAAACLWWGDVLTVLLFAAGALLPGLVDGAVGTLLRALPGSTGADAVATSAADPRNFVGSSGATYFLAATLAAAVVLRGSGPLRERVLAGLVPVLGLVAFVAVDDAHGLVTAEGFVIGLVGTAVVTAVVAVRPPASGKRRSAYAQPPGRARRRPNAPGGARARRNPRPEQPAEGFGNGSASDSETSPLWEVSECLRPAATRGWRGARAHLNRISRHTCPLCRLLAGQAPTARST